MDFKIFDTLLEPIFVINKERKILYCNDPAAAMADLSPRKIVRQQMIFDSLFHFDQPISHLDQIETVQDPTPYQEVAFQIESGKQGRVQLTMQPIECPSESAWIVFFRDVTLEETLQRKYRAELEQKEDVILDLQKAQAELQNYSKNLEKMVEERTAEISQLNQLLSALLDSLGQGFFAFNPEGLCLEVASKACLDTVETMPSGKMIWDVLGLPPEQQNGFKKWMQTAFSEMLPFEDLAPLAPPTFAHSQGRHIKLEYYPLRTSAGTIEAIVVVSTDITDLVHAQNEAETERAHAKMIVSLVQNKREAQRFVREANFLIGVLNQQMTAEKLDHLDTFRSLHTLKGGSASFAIKTVVDQCHACESILAEWKEQPSDERLLLLKNECAKIPKLFRQFLDENTVILGDESRQKERWIERPESDFQKFAAKYLLKDPKAEQDFATTFLYEAAEDMLTSYHELVTNTAETLQKEISPLQVIGGKLRIEPERFSQLFSTFVHAFRNSIDHGIEMPDEREASGKPRAGEMSISLSKTKTGNLLVIIQDDGRGIAPALIREKLAAKGIDASKESDQDVIQHVFDSQFSTKEDISDISGRGVGMDAIYTCAVKLGGKAWVESVIGRGTRLHVEVPFEAKKAIKAA